MLYIVGIICSEPSDIENAITKVYNTETGNVSDIKFNVVADRVICGEWKIENFDALPFEKTVKYRTTNIEKYRVNSVNDLGTIFTVCGKHKSEYEIVSGNGEKFTVSQERFEKMIASDSSRFTNVGEQGE